MARREHRLKPEAETGTAAGMLQTLIESNLAQARQLETLKQVIETGMAEVQRKEAEQAALLGEARRELAEKDAALEIEKRKRETAERRLAEHDAFVEWIRLMPPLPAPVAATAPAMAPAPSAPDAAGGADADADARETSEATEETNPESTGLIGFDDTECADLSIALTADLIDAGIAADVPPRVVIAIEIAAHQAGMLNREAHARGMTAAAFVVHCVERELGSAASANSRDEAVSAFIAGPAAPGG